MRTSKGYILTYIDILIYNIYKVIKDVIIAYFSPWTDLKNICVKQYVYTHTHTHTHT